MNSPEIELSSELASFKDYSKALTPPHKGLAVASFEFLKGAHNSFGRKTEMDDWDLGLVDTFKASRRKTKAEKSKGKKKAKEEEEEEMAEEDWAYHYIAFVHHDGAIWELDGLKRQPVKFRKHPSHTPFPAINFVSYRHMCPRGLALVHGSKAPGTYRPLPQEHRPLRLPRSGS